MFNNLTERLNTALQRFQGRITEDNIKDTLREVRIALLEADVALPVAKEFITHVQDKAIGQDVMRSLTPGQALIKIVNDELVSLMGEANAELNLAAQPPAVILMAGLQGSGKTTTVAKLTRYLQEKHEKSVLVTSADIYRPAAIKQLETLANDIQCHYHPSDPSQKPVDIATSAVDAAKRKFIDVVIVDTAGRLGIDEAMMTEIKHIHSAINPVETLFVVDSMTGQDAVNTAKAFDEALPLTGIILTKTDGDSRGGAALSMRQVTGKPIKFLGVGEKTDALEAFHPDRIASRILGMGDIVSLVEEVEQKVDKAKAEKIARKLKKGKSFDFEDFLEQLQQMKNMGGMTKLLDKLPGVGGIPAQLKNQVSDGMFVKFEAIINSMTLKERRFPALIKGSRKRRIAAGSGTTIQEVNKMLKQFAQMQKMMKKFSKGGMQKMMRQFQGKLPPGGFPGGDLPF